MRILATCICFLVVSVTGAAPPGFVKRTIALDAPPVGLAFDTQGVLYALEAAPSGSKTATMRSILPDGSFGPSFTLEAESDEPNFFVGSMTYDPFGDRLLVSNNTTDGWLYAVGKAGGKTLLNPDNPIAGIAGIAVRDSGEIFVTTSPFFSTGGEILQVDRADGNISTPVLSNLGFGAGLAFDLNDDLIVQDADTNTFQGRLQRLPISGPPGGITFGTPVTLLSGMQSGAGVMVDSEGNLFTTGSGGLFQAVGLPLTEVAFDSNGNPFQFATAIAFDAGTQTFERFAGPNGGRLAYLADFGFASQDSFVTILTPAKPGDYNGDGYIDADDFSVWRGTFGSTTDASADGNLDGVIDTRDYVIWRKNVPATGAGAAATEPGSVPEPAAMALVMTGLVVLPIAFRRRQS